MLDADGRVLNHFQGANYDNSQHPRVETYPGDLQICDPSNLTVQQVEGSSAGWRISGVDLEHDELGEHVSVHLKTKASRAVGREQTEPSPPE